jgi:primosomal protein N'
MYVVDVIPFSRTAPAGTLSYRSRTALVEGTIVEVSLRRKQVQGLVVGCQSVAEAKATLKTASFMLTKTVPRAVGALQDAIRDAAVAIAAYHATTLGSALASLFGEQVRSELSLADERTLVSGDGFKSEALEKPLAARAATYRTIIETNRTAGRATLLVVPTIAETEYWRSALKEFKPQVLSSVLSEKKRGPALIEATKSTSLVISTPSYSWTPIIVLGGIIIERMGAGAYRMPRRPYLDMRIALIELARNRLLPLTMGDFPLPLEYRPHPDAPLDAVAGAVTIIDARREKPEAGVAATTAATQAAPEEDPWTAIPKPMHDAIGHAIGAGGRVLVLAVRKGYAPSVVCRDCGTTRTDEFGNVLTFTKAGPQGRVFRTADGTGVESADVVCAHCGSWHLVPLGIGVERVEEELRAAFQDATIIHFEGDTVRTAASAKKALLRAEEPGTIIVGTEAALPWLLALHLPPFDLTAIASADSLLALPFWRARERFVRLGLSLASMGTRLVLGTRLPDDAAVDAIRTPRETSFFTEETGLRKALGYPPFGTLLVLQSEGTRVQVAKLDPNIRSMLGDRPFTVLPDRALTRTEVRRSYVVRITANGWPDQAFSERLRTLPPSVRILVDTESF